MYIETTATKKIKRLNKRLRFIQGGTGASKTVSIVLILIAKAQTDKEPTTTSIVSESIPHLKKGAMRDFLDILQTHNYFDEKRWNRTDKTYTFETGSTIEFFSANDGDKVRGPRRDRLFINECNNVPFKAYEQLEVRTNELVFCDFNPVTEFWYHENIENNPEMDHDFLILTYQDNEALDERVVQSIEARKDRDNWWRVYGEGKLGELEGKIYSGWQIIDEIPHEARLEVRGLDFGYSIDPTAIVDIYYLNGGYILDEQLYQTGLSNRRIADVIENLPQPETRVMADSAEPKSIDELKSYGINVQGADKGKHSVRHGIQYVQDLPISVTARSTKLIKEYRNYVWETDSQGDPIHPNEPEKNQWDHLLDAARYGLTSLEHKNPYTQAMKKKQQMYINDKRKDKIKKEYGL